MISGLLERFRWSTSIRMTLESAIDMRFFSVLDLPAPELSVSWSSLMEFDAERAREPSGESLGRFSAAGVEGTDRSKRRPVGNQALFDSSRGVRYSASIW